MASIGRVVSSENSNNTPPVKYYSEHWDTDLGVHVGECMSLSACIYTYLVCVSAGVFVYWFRNWDFHTDHQN